jgi:hypothetical protein
MKPASFAAIILRFLAIYLIFSALVAFGGSLLLSNPFAPTLPPEFGAGQGKVDAMFATLSGFQFKIAAVALVSGVLLYVWSAALGRMIAAGLD